MGGTDVVGGMRSTEDNGDDVIELAVGEFADGFAADVAGHAVSSENLAVVDGLTEAELPTAHAFAIQQ
jgi:hypothetical protein